VKGSPTCGPSLWLLHWLFGGLELPVRVAHVPLSKRDAVDVNSWPTYPWTLTAGQDSVCAHFLIWGLVPSPAALRSREPRYHLRQCYAWPHSTGYYCHGCLDVLQAWSIGSCLGDSFEVAEAAHTAAYGTPGTGVEPPLHASRLLVKTSTSCVSSVSPAQSKVSS
jgi:hypothetical protein